MMSARTILQVNTFDELHSVLPSVTVQVPPRGLGRKNDHVELYAMLRLLATMPRAARDFPLRLVKRERPDFLLDCGPLSIGVEHTEAVPRNAAKEAELRAKGYGSVMHHVSPASVDDPPKSRKQIIAEIEANQSPPGWLGDEAERQWVRAMAQRVVEKLATASKPGFTLYEDNWLVIYDNWPAPLLKREKALAMLRAECLTDDAWRVFTRIFILSQMVLMEITVSDEWLPAVHPMAHSAAH